MKTISKILSIALCLAMVLGLFTFGVAAADQTAVLVDDWSTLAAGDKIVLVYKDSSSNTYAMTNTPSGTSKFMTVAKDPAITGLNLTVPDTYGVVTLGAGSTAGSFTLQIGSKYLRCKNDGNYVYLDSLDSENLTQFDWKFVTVSGASKIISVATEDLAKPRYLQGNKTTTNARFAAYIDTQTDPVLYKIAEGDVPEHTHEGEAISFEWNDSEHWQVYACGTEVEDSRTGHTVVDGVCTTDGCDYKEIYTIAEALAGAIGNKFTVKGEVTFIDGKNVNIQDATGGINIYLTANATCSVGDVIKATGTKADYNGLPQLGSATYTVEQEGVNAIAALEGGDELIVDENLCKKLSLSGSFLVTDIASNGTITMVLSSGDTIQIYKAPTVEGLKAGDVITKVDCVLSIYNNLQLRCNAASDIQYTSFVLSDDMSMVLNNTLFVQFRIQGVTNYAGYIAELTVGTADPINAVIDPSGIISAPLMLSQLDETLTLNVYCGETLVATKTDMANDYLQRMIDSASNSQAVKDICTALLAYGEYTEKAINDTASDALALNGTLDADLAGTDDNTSADKNMMRLNLTHAVNIEIKLSAQWLQAGYSYTVNGGANIPLSQESDLLVTISDIPVTQWGQMQTVVVYNAENEPVNTINYAVMSYAYDRLEGKFAAEPEAAVGLNNLLTAMANYYMAVINSLS